MKYFRLADKAYRKNVDLRLYEDDIAAAIAKVKPNAQLFVEKDGFYTIPELRKRESIMVSQELRRNSVPPITLCNALVSSTASHVSIIINRRTNNVRNNKNHGMD